jgi:hypothetical protein
MTYRELLQMALYDLVCLARYAERAGEGAEIDWASVAQDIGQDARKTVKALRDRLAQPEPEPVAWVVDGEIKVRLDMAGKLYYSETNVYTAPPKREWVGFTAAERDEIVPMLVQSLINHDDKTMAVLLRAILIDVEERLKEKNT